MMTEKEVAVTINESSESPDEDELRVHTPIVYSDSELEGEIQGQESSSTKKLDTLDEPVLETLKRDLKTVGIKFINVLYPMKSRALLSDWDLWGPLVLCVSIALLLQGDVDSSHDSRGPQFTEAFVLTSFGAFVVTLNIKLLGGTISFFQSLCVMGYGLLPLLISLLVCKSIILFAAESVVLFISRLLVTVGGFVWATFTTMSCLASSQPPRKVGLAVYPIFLFYFVVSWLIVSQTHHGH